MMGLTLAEIISTIQEKAGLSEEDIRQKITAKRDKLSGFVSEEGAAHIVANELGIDLMESIRKHGIKIEKLTPGMRVGVTGKVIKMYDVRSYQKAERSGKIGSFLLGDETGVVRIVIWDENLIAKIENGEIKQDTILKIDNGGVKENNGYTEMHLGNYSTIEMNPNGVTIEVKQMQQTATQDPEQIALGKLSEAKPGETMSIYGTIVQVFDPRFYEGCSECGKKRTEQGCPTHPNGTAQHIPILNFFVDDGHAGMRGVAFRENVAQMLQATPEAVAALKDKPEGFEALKAKTLGNQYLMTGRIQSNEMYNRSEFMVRNIHEAEAKTILAKFLN